MRERDGGDLHGAARLRASRRTIVADSRLYGRTVHLLTRMLTAFGIEVDVVDLQTRMEPRWL